MSLFFGSAFVSLCEQINLSVRVVEYLSTRFPLFSFFFKQLSTLTCTNYYTNRFPCNSTALSYIWKTFVKYTKAIVLHKMEWISSLISEKYFTHPKIITPKQNITQNQAGKSLKLFPIFKFQMEIFYFNNKIVRCLFI